MVNHIYEVAEVQLVYKSKVKASNRPKVAKSAEVYELVKERWNFDTIDLYEQFKIVFLNRASRVLGILDISSGGMNGTVCDPKIVFAAALKAAASSIILVHNHPSGSLKPSSADINLTQRLCSAGCMLGIDVVEHLIISSEGYFSFADDGLL